MKRIASLAAAVTLLSGSAAFANCPTLTTGDSAKYLAIYTQEPSNVGSSWRFKIRPRNGACFTAGSGFQSPVNTVGLSDGAQQSAAVHGDGHSCDDKYKSYMSVDVPSYDAVKSVAATGKATQIGWKVCMTKGGSCYRGAIVVVPSQTTPNQVDVKGVCFK